MPVDAQPTLPSADHAVDLRALSTCGSAPTWLYNLRILWAHRIQLTRIVGAALVAGLVVSLLIPKSYVSQARIMPPETSGGSSALLTALAGRTLGSDALGGLAASLIGGHNTGALFVDLLRSTSVTDRLVERFQLQSVYHMRYRVDAAKVLVRKTTIVQDKKSGVLTLSVTDTDPARARDMAQAYLDELNTLVNRTGNSSAHQERVFIEKRLQAVRGDLERAQEAMSEFSSTHSAIDLHEQARATVESEARVQGELIAAQGELQSLRQLYGDGNVRVREIEARIAGLKHELLKMGGSSSPLSAPAKSDGAGDQAASASYLPLRQVPRLAVPFANLYREVHVQETVYDLLTQQYEIARIQEAKDIPAVNVIDAPAIPEKKSFPPRALMTIGMTIVTLIVASFGTICHHYWRLIDMNDPRKSFALEVIDSIRAMRPARWLPRRPA
jgi:capsule polysaccharide export protein KpsE/RkpR